MKLKVLVQMMAVIPATLMPMSTALHASDLSLYRGGTTGKTSILLMLDTSGSMGISSLVLPNDNKYGSPGDVALPLCERTSVAENGSPSSSFNEWKYNAVDSRAKITINGVANSTNIKTRNKTAFYKEVNIGGVNLGYYLRGCGNPSIGANGQLNESATGKFDRLSKLKDAIITLLADTSSEGLSNKTVMGLGNFSSKTNINISDSQFKLVDGHSGSILVPNGVLDNTQRLKLGRAIAEFKSLDTTTDEDGTANPNLKMSSKVVPYTTDYKKSSSGTPTAQAYAEAGAYMMGTSTGVDSSQAALTSIRYVYDGYMMMQQIAAPNEQAYFVCVQLGNSLTTSVFNTSGVQDVKQCVNNWPSYDSSSKTVANTTINGGVYKPDGSGGWIKMSSQADFKNQSGVTMKSAWETLSQLPEGWRYGGWMKVKYEPLDIEPVVGMGWGPYADKTAYGIVSYRTNPFALVEQAQMNPNLYTDNLVGGMRYSVSTSMQSGNYIAGGSTSSCDGNGIYFLTDGAPNSTKDIMAQTIMNTTLRNNATYTFSAKPSGTGVLISPTLKSGLFSGETGGWEYIGEYAKKMRNRTDSSSTQKNPLDMNIKTAVVGFGASFAGLTKNADGTYNCASAPNDDAKNACLWGSKSYGDGGFYYAENSDDIKNSIIKFVTDVSVSFPPASLGSISVPRDPLDQTQVMPTGFFPMLLPQESSSVLSWAGNLKKYKILGGTLKDSSNNAIYNTVNNQQVINSSAKDLWSIAAASDDHSLVNSGGAWGKIPVPSTLNITGEPSKSDSTRNVFTMDGNDLKAVTKANLATDYLGNNPLSITNINIAMRYNLLNYLGYKSPVSSLLNKILIDTLAITPSNPYRYLGGVVHSTPLVVTDSATLNSTGNTVGSRNEYVVYGSMEGGLHIVDASTGEEKSVFVPKEVLDNQNGSSLANSDFKATGTLSYGVDAPWAADNTFKVVTSSTGGTATAKYQSRNMNIYGGLRMGGAALYGLNISTPTSPSLLFRITPSTSGFARMGQIWSKPTIADIRVKGERKRVLIFGGGYDSAVYERDAASFTEPTSATLGNAIYVVDASNGDLLWMASSDTSGIANTKKIESSDMLYSVVGQPVVRDYDADGLIDMIYFADLGGQIFRVDLNNAEQTSKTQDKSVGVRVKRLATLRTGSGSSLFVPRFYERLTTAVFGDSANRFVLVTAGSGNRSFPLDSSNAKNKIYGILDYDAATKGIENSNYDTTKFKAEATSTNLINRGILGKTSTTISNWGTGGSITKDTAVAAMGPTGAYRGWSFDLRSTGDENSQFYAKSFEESQLISGDLYVNLYDPKAILGGGVSNSCGGGVQGLSTTHRICAPYADCAAYVKQDYQGILGPILGLTTEGSRTSGLVGSVVATQEACVGKCPSNLTSLTDQNLLQYSQIRKIKPTKWYER